MKKVTTFIALLGLSITMIACGNATEFANTSENMKADVLMENSDEKVQIRIKVGDTVLTALMEDNETAQALVDKMPMTLSMRDLFDREMSHRFGAGSFPVAKTRSDRYEVGDLIYWPPMGSFVILYKQDGDEFERVHVVHINSGVEIFENTGSTEVTFEVIK